MSNQQIMIDEPASNLADKYLDAEGVTIGSTLMLRERTEIAGSTATGIADVLTVDPGTSAPGLTVRDVLGTIIASRLAGTLNVQLDPGHTLGSITTVAAVTNITNSIATHLISTAGTLQVKLDPSSKIAGSDGSIAVYFDRGNPSVNIGSQSSTLNVQLDPGHTLGNIGTIGSITNTVAVFFSPANPSVSATFSSASMEVVPTTGSRKTMDDAHAAQRVLVVGSQSNASLQVTGITNSINTYIGGTAGTLGVRVGQIDGSVAVYFSPSNPSVSATFSAASIEVIPTTGSRKITDDAHAAQRVLIVGSQTAASLTINGTLTGITNSLAVHVLSTNGTMAVNVGKVDGTVTVRLDPGNTLGTVNQGVASATQAWLTNSQNTASIFTVSGSTSGVSVSGVNLVAPSSAYNFKVFAYSLQTTGIVSVVAKFVNGSGASQTEFWRPLVTSNQTASAPIGANLAVPPPSYLFATGTNTSLNLLLDTASLVHYSVSYIKESA